jgi:hypothetical protein
MSYPSRPLNLPSLTDSQSLCTRRFFVRGGALLLGLSASNITWGDGTDALVPIFAILTQAIERADFRHLPILDPLKNIRDGLQLLEQILNRRRAPLPAEYDLVFHKYESDLTLALRNDLQSNRSLDLAGTLKRDLEIKTQFLTESAGFWPFDKAPLILVKVKTLRGADPAPGYSVRCNPLRDAERPDVLFPFPSDTNNAERLLPPGLYWLKLYRGDRSILGRLAPVGVSRSDTEEISIDVSAYAQSDTRRN